MWRSHKFIVGTVLTVAILLGIIGGVVLAANNGEDSQAENKHEALLDRVCEIYEENTGVAINSEALQDAFADARTQMAENRADMLVADMVNGLNLTDEQKETLQEWLDTRTEGVPFGPGFRGHGRFPGRGWPCTMAEE
jgi:xanthine/uracil permease